MSSITGSMDKKSPDKSPKGTPKGKGKQIVDPADFFKPQKVKTSTTCFVDEDILQSKGTCVFRGEFAAPNTRKLGLVTMPVNFQAMGRDDEYIDVFRRLGLKDYFRLPPCGVDIPREPTS